MNNQIVVVLVLIGCGFVCQGWAQEVATSVQPQVRTVEKVVPVVVTKEQSSKLLALANGKVAGSFKGCKGVGPVREAAIFEMSTKTPFKAVDELALVKGIGVKTLQNMIAFITVPSVPDSEEIE